MTKLDPMKPPHIVVIPSPGMGHVTPMLELAKRLIQHHHCHVTFLHITTHASHHQTHHLHSPNLPPPLTVLDLPSSAVNFAPTTLPFSRFCITIRETLLHSLKPTLSHFQQKPQALITDMFCTQALDTCTELSIPSYILFTASARFLAFSMFCRDFTNCDVSGEFLQVPGCAPLRTEDIFSSYGADDEWFSYHLCRVPKASGIFVNTYEDLEPVSVRAIRENPFYKDIPMPPVFPVGPLVKEAEAEPVYGAGEECLAWLDKQPAGSVVFVSLGSGGTLCSEQLTELAMGLELSQQRFLWVARAPSARAESEVTFLKEEEEEAKKKKKGPECYLPEGFLERTKGLGMVVDSWAPQVMVLGHVAIGAFLSHCGWNSVLESVCNGVPMITWPLFGDQMMNGSMVEEMGVAVKPVREGKGVIVGREEVERVVRAAMEGMEGKGMGLRAKEVKETALKALKRGGPSYQVLAAMVNHWNSHDVRDIKP